MVDSLDYIVPKVWSWTKPSGGTFASINRPIAGPTHEKELPVGRHPLQLYSLGTPNGQKATILRLTAPSFESKTDITFGGVSVDANGNWAPRPTESVTLESDRFSVELPASSAAVIQIHAG